MSKDILPDFLAGLRRFSRATEEFSRQLVRRIYQLPGIRGRTTIAARHRRKQKFADKELL